MEQEQRIITNSEGIAQFEFNPLKHAKVIVLKAEIRIPERANTKVCVE